MLCARVSVGICIVGFPFFVVGRCRRGTGSLWTDLRRLTGSVSCGGLYRRTGLGSGHVEPLGLGTGRGDLLADCSAVSDWVVGAV